MNDSLHDNEFNKEEAELFSKLGVPWKRSKDEVWVELSKRVANPLPQIKTKPRFVLWQMAAAAVVIIGFGLTIFLRTYTVTQVAQAGKHISAMLPDGSKVDLNAGSEIAFAPYWWFAKREVKLTGEAYFEVKKGETFTVSSAIGTTEVLGTSFNVFSRGDRYEVVCLTGKVKVIAASTQDAVILHPSQKASLQETGQLKVDEKVNPENAAAWKSNILFFNSVPLSEVFAEIGRQYNVKIELSADLNKPYTGNFEKKGSAEEALGIICKPFQLTVDKKSNSRFVINR